MKKTVVFDFDGVIHSYTSGWKGAGVISDAPVPGIRGAIESIRSSGYEVVVVSTRTSTPEGYNAVASYLDSNGILVDRIMSDKPPAIVYIDDRAICFDGNPEVLLEKIEGFTPWYKKDCNSPEYKEIISHIQKTWPDWKIDYCNDNILISKHAKKLKKKDVYLKKSEVLLEIQNYIRNIQMMDGGTDAGIPQLYSVMKSIESMQGDIIP